MKSLHDAAKEMAKARRRYLRAIADVNKGLAPTSKAHDARRRLTVKQNALFQHLLRASKGEIAALAEGIKLS